MTEGQRIKEARRIVKLSQWGEHKKMTEAIDSFNKSVKNTHQVWGYLRNECEGDKSGLQDFASIVIYYHVIKEMKPKKR